MSFSSGQTKLSVISGCRAGFHYSMKNGKKNKLRSTCDKTSVFARVVVNHKERNPSVVGGTLCMKVKICLFFFLSDSGVRIKRECAQKYFLSMRQWLFQMKSNFALCSDPSFDMPRRNSMEVLCPGEIIWKFSKWYKLNKYFTLAVITHERGNLKNRAW